MDSDDEVKSRKIKDCCLPDSLKTEKDHIVLRAINQFNEELYEDLEMRRRAIKNWNKLKIILTVFKVFAGKVLENTIKRELS